MRTIVAAALVALGAMTFAGTALAQSAGEGCPGSVKTTDAGGKEGGTTNANAYAVTADVYLQGTGFPSDLASASYTIEDVNDAGAILKTGTISPISGGSFLQRIWSAGERAGITGHEFKVTVTYPRTGQPDCQKSDNFFIVPPPFGGQAAAAGVATAGGVAVVPTVGCPRGISVAQATLAVGRRGAVTVRVRRNGQAVRNAVVVLRGAGVRSSKVTGASGTVRFNVVARRRGAIQVYVPNVCLSRAGVAGVSAAGAALAG
jgi:hypothetical protein